VDKTYLKEYLELRAAIYKLLAFPWYKEPVNDWFSKFTKYIPVFEKIAEEVGGEEAGKEMLKKGTSLLKKMPEWIDEQKYASKFAYIFLVLNAGGMRSITPHESVYLSSSGLIKQDEWESVLEEFVNEGIGLEKSFRESEDHISAEMHFIALLSKQAASYIDSDRNKFLQKIETQKRFLTEHTDRWVEMLKEDVERLTDDPLYLAAANLTAGFVHADTAFLCSSVEFMNIC
jgi:TorA maturation chaperone TorD